MTPQIIYICIILIDLILIGYYHGKPKKGKHNVFVNLIVMAITLSLLCWGGFFNVIINK